MELMSPAPPVSWGDAQGKLEIVIYNHRAKAPGRKDSKVWSLPPQGVTDSGTRSQPSPGLGQGLPATRIPASPGSLGTSYHHPRTASEVAQQTRPPWQLAPTQRKGARERGSLLGPTCSGSDTPSPLMVSLIKNQLRDHPHLTQRARALQLLSRLSRI